MEYTVRSQIVVPKPEELDQVDHLAPRTHGQWTKLPADLDPRIGEMAERWTADATSDYRKVLAIQQHFHDGRFVYSTDVEIADDADALLKFLTQTKAGFCQQYSSAMAVMVRTLGPPARIAVGYRSGTLQEDGSYLSKLMMPTSGSRCCSPATGGSSSSRSPAPNPIQRAGRHVPKPGHRDGCIVTSTSPSSSTRCGRLLTQKDQVRCLRSVAGHLVTAA